MNHVCQDAENRLLVVADVGSTKGDWIAIAGQEQVVRFTTTGFNPSYDPAEKIRAILRDELRMRLPFHGAKGVVWYYGAGCRMENSRNRLIQLLSEVFDAADIMVHHDLLGAARATCGRSAGIVCILGTGSNSMLFDGESEVDSVANLGFILGDEGSGSHIGKCLVQAWQYREMPENLKAILENACPGGRDELLINVYRSDGRAAAYLAGLAGLFVPLQSHSFIRNLVGGCFRSFIKRHVCKYHHYEAIKVHFTGGIAWHYKEILVDVLEEFGLICGEILQKPVEKLFEFHGQSQNIPAK